MTNDNGVQESSASVWIKRLLLATSLDGYISIMTRVPGEIFSVPLIISSVHSCLETYIVTRIIPVQGIVSPQAAISSCLNFNYDVSETHLNPIILDSIAEMM